MPRAKITDFELASRIYASASVSVKKASDGTLATLYAALTGSTTLPNPQRLDHEGKFVQPVYYDVAVYLDVSGLSVGAHTTGVLPQPETFSLQNVTSPVLNTIAALKALSGIALTGAAFVLGFAAAGDLGGGLYWWNAADARADDGGAIIRPDSAPATGRWNYKFEDRLPAGIYGVKGDRTTDDLAAFNSAVAGAFALRTTLFVQPLPPGYFYKLSNVLQLVDRDSFVLEGGGVQSLFCISNASGANCISVDSSVHTTIRGIGITGIIGSGHGIEYKNASHRPNLKDTWIGWVDGDGIRVTEAISGRMSGVTIDQNNGYNPGGLGTGVAPGDRGNTDRGIFIRGHAGGLNNDWKCNDIHLEALGQGSNYLLQVGEAGVIPVASFSLDGLIQGNPLLAYLRTLDANITAHIEPTVGTGTLYGVVFDTCTNTWIDGRQGQCAVDVRFQGECRNCGVQNARMCGAHIDALAQDILIENGEYKHIILGITGGNIIDESGRAVIRQMKNASNDLFAAADNLRGNRSLIFETNFEDWDIGQVVPCGMSKTGGTVTRSTAQVENGTYSSRHVFTADLTQYQQIVLNPINAYRGKRVYVQARVRNLTTAGLAYLTGVSNTGSVSQQSFLANTFETMRATFSIPAAATSFAIRLSGLVGTVDWDYCKVEGEGVAPVSEMTLLDGATPEITNSAGYHIAALRTGGITPITDFRLPGAVGKDFTLTFDHATTVTHGGRIALAGAVNFVGTTGDTLTFRYGGDDVFREVGRAVI